MTIGILSAALLGVVGQASGPPTVYTLTLDDLLTRHYPGTDQRLKLTATAGTTGFIELDDNATIYSASAIATDMQTQLAALTGYSGKVTVDGASSEAGDKYTFTITFDASLGAVTLAFHASSVWRSPITLTESVTQQGVNPVFEQVSLEASLDEFGDGTVTDNIGNSQTVAANTVSNIAASGWTCTNPGTSPGLFVCDTPGPQGATTTPSSGSGSIFIIETGVGGQIEIHTVTPSPTEPTGGTFAIAGEASLAYDSEIGMSLNTVSAAWNKTSGTSLADGPVAFTTDVDVDAGDSELNVDGTNLTAPEITHSIA